MSSHLLSEIVGNLRLLYLSNQPHEKPERKGWNLNESELMCAWSSGEVLRAGGAEATRFVICDSKAQPDGHLLSYLYKYDKELLSLVL
jgi:hypothetical protein